jgi:RNA polymerase sigma factor (sigma-70 family)
MPRRAEVTTSDQDLIAACLRGEQAGWDALVDRYAPLIYSIPLKYGFTEADAADVFQSVCVRLIEKLQTVRAPGGLAAWIATTTSRECLAVIRKRRREPGLSAADGLWVATAEPADPQPLPEDELLLLERQQVVRTAVSQLPGNCRRLVEALFSDALERRSYQQLADGLGIPMNSLGPTRTRCFAKLRRLLNVAGYAP